MASIARRRSTRFRHQLAIGTALPMVLPLTLLFAAPAAAQLSPDLDSVTVGTVTFDTNNDAVFNNTPNGTAQQLDVRIGSANPVIEWDGFSIGRGAGDGCSGACTVNFISTVGATAVLNRVTGAGASNLRGALNAGTGVEVWLVNPAGITLGPNAAINTGGLVLSTGNISNTDFGNGGDFTLTSGLLSTAEIRGGGAAASVRTNGGLLLVQAARIDVDAAFDAANGASPAGNVAFVTATDATYTPTPGSPLSIVVNAGSSVTQDSIIRGSVAGRNLEFAMLTEVGALARLLNIQANLVATQASASDRGIILAAGDVGAVGGVITNNSGVLAGPAVSATLAGTVTTTGGVSDLTANASGNFTSSGGATSVGGSVDVRAGTAIDIQATTTAGGAIRIENDGNTLATAGLVAGTTIDIIADDDAAVGSARSIGDQAISIDATNGDIVVGDIAGGAVTLTATNGNVAATGDVTAAGNYTVLAESVDLGDGTLTGGSDLQQATGIVDITASAGTIDGVAGLILRSNSGNALATNRLILDGDDGLSFAAGSQLQGGTTRSAAVAIRAGNGQPIVLGNVAASGLVEADAAHAAFAAAITHNASLTTGSIDSRQAIDIELSSGSITTGAVSVTDAGAGIRLVANTAGTSAVTTGNLSAVDGAISVTAEQNAQVGTVGTAGPVTLRSDARDIVAGAITTNGDATLFAARDALLATVDAGGSVAVTGTTGSITADTISGATTASAVARSLDIDTMTASGGTLTATATAGTATIGDATGRDGVSVTASGIADVGDVSSALGNALVRSTGASASVDRFEAVAGTATLQAATSANLTGSSDVTGTLAVTGATVNLGVDGNSEVIASDGAVEITSTTGAITGGVGLTLRSDADGVSGERLLLDSAGAISFDAGSQLFGGPSSASLTAPVVIRAPGAVTLGAVRADALLGTPDLLVTQPLSLAGPIDIRGPLLTDQAVQITSAGALTVAAVTSNLGGVTLDGGTTLTTGLVTALAGNVDLSAGSLLTNAGASATGIIDLDGASVVSTALLSAQGTISVDSTGAGGLSVAAATSSGAAVTLTAGGTGSAIVGAINGVGVSISGAGINQVAAGAGDVDSSAGLTIAGGTGAVALDAIEASSGLTVTGAGITLGNVTALGGNASVQSTLGASVGIVTANAGTITVGAASGNASASRFVTGGANDASLSAAGGNATLDTGSVGGDLSITASGPGANRTAAITGTTSVGGNLVASGQRIALGDDAGTETISAVGFIDATATAGDIIGGAGLTLTAGSTGSAAGPLFLDASGNILFDASSAANGVAGFGVRLGAGGDLTLGSVTAFRIASVGAGIGNARTFAASLSTSGDIRFLGPATFAAAQVIETSSGLIDVADIGLLGGAPLTLRTTGGVGLIDFEDLDTGGNITVAATGTVNGGSITATSVGGATSVTGTAITIGSIAGRAGSVTVDGSGNVALTSVTTTGPAGAILLDADGTLAVANVTSAAALTLGSTATDSIAVTGTAQGAGLVDVNSAGLADIATLVSTAGAIDADVGSADFGTVRTTPGTGLIDVLAATGDILIDSLLGGGAVNLTANDAAGRDVTVAAGTVAGTTTILASDDITLGEPGPFVTQGLTLTAGGTTTLGNVSATDVLVTGATIDLATISASGDLTLTSTVGDIDVGTATAGGGVGDLLRITSAANVTATSLTGGGVEVHADNGLADIDAITAQAAGVTLTANSALLGTVAAPAGAVSIVTDVGGITVESVDAQANATLNATGGGISITDFATAGGALALVTTGDIDVTNAATGASVTLTANSGAVTAASVSATGGAVTVGANSAALGTVDATGAIGITTDAGGAGATSLDAGGTLDVVATGGNVSVTDFAAAGGALSLESTTGDVIVANGVTGGSVALTAAGGSVSTGDVGASAGAVTVIADEATLGAVTATAAITLTTDVGGVTADSLDAGADLSVDAAGPVAIAGSVNAAGAAGLVSTGDIDIGGDTGAAQVTLTAANGAITTAAIAAGSGPVAIVANSADLGAVSAAGGSGSIAVTVDAGNAALASATAATTLDIDAGSGTIQLGGGSAGGNARFAADQFELGGAFAAPTVTVRTSGANVGMALGDGGPAGGLALSNAEFARLSTGVLTLDAQGGPVRIGTLDLVAAAGSTGVDVLTTGRIDLSGVTTVAGSGRSFRLGGTADPAGRASALVATADAAAGGRIRAPGNVVELRATRIAFGLDAFIAALDLDGSGGGIDAGTAASNFVGNSSSQLYNAALGGGSYSDTEIVTADRLVVRFGDYALFQNSAVAGANAGVTIGGAGNPALTVDGSGSAGGDAFALFGTINGVTGTAAALLGPAVTSFSATDPANSRINGCLVGSGAGCLTTVVVQPSQGVFDVSRADVLRVAADFDVPFDPVIGVNNEALFADLFAGAADRSAGEGCSAADRSDCPSAAPGAVPPAAPNGASPTATDPDTPPADTQVPDAATGADAR